MKKIYFFDAKYFFYCLKHLLKSTSVIVFAIIFFILIISYSYVVPTIAQTTAYELFSVPIAMLFLICAISLLAICTTVNLFKNQIEDGSELLVLSKCLTRQEIVNAKIVVYLLFTFVVLLIGGCLSFLSFINGNGFEFSYYLIFAGIIACGLIISLLFAGITIFFCLFFQKTKALLCATSVALIILFYSIATTLTTKNYINNLENGYLPLGKTISLNFKDDGDTNLVNLYSIDTSEANEKGIDYSGVNAIYQIESEYLKSLSKVSSWTYYLNFGNQFAQMLMMDQSIKDLGKVSDTLKVFNYPTKLNAFTGSIDQMYDNPIKISNIDFDSVKFNWTTNQLSYDLTPLNYVVPEYRFKSRIWTTTNIGDDNDTTLYEKKYYVYDIDDIKFSSEMWNKVYTDAQESIIQDFNNYLNDSYSGVIRKPYESFIEHFFKSYFVYKNGYIDKEELIQYLIEISYSAYNKLSYEYNNINFFKLIDPDRQINRSVKFGDLFDFNNILNKTMVEKLTEFYLPNKFSKDTTVYDYIQFIKNQSLLNKQPYKAFYQYWKNESKNNLELITLLGFIGADFNPIVSKGKTTYDTLDDYWKSRFGYKTYFSQSINMSDLTNNPNSYYSLYYRLSLTAKDTNSFVSPVKVEIDFFFDTKWLFVIWSLIAITVFLINCYIYARKDVY